MLDACLFFRWYSEVASWRLHERVVVISDLHALCEGLRTTRRRGASLRRRSLRCTRCSKVANPTLPRGSRAFSFPSSGPREERKLNNLRQDARVFKQGADSCGVSVLRFQQQRI